MTTIELENGSTLSLEIAPPANRESFFVFGVHKGGSVLLNRIFRMACEKLGIPQILIPRSAFKQGLPDDIYANSARLEPVLFPNGYCYTGYRYFPPFLRSFFSQPRQSILLVRDPRDMLTSMFYSVAYSHSITQGDAGKGQLLERQRVQNLDVDTYALENVPFVLNEFSSYEHLLQSDRTRVYRYEDIIFSKAEWIADMLSFLGESLPTDAIRQIADHLHRVPQSEQPDKHVRKVTPGDHKEKLKPETIAELNTAFREVFAQYGYSED